MKKKIAIIAGGDSSEIVISLKSAEGLYSFIDKDKYDLYIATIKKGEWNVRLADGEQVPIDKNDFSFLEKGQKQHFDFAYITIHGTPGEDGRLQAYFDMIDMPYSSCGMLASTITFNKFVCNQYLHNFGVKIAKSIHLFKGQEVSNEEVVQRLGLPVFVKPNDGGSSFGVTKVKNESDIQPAIEKAFKEGKEVVIESFISGTEVTCGCYKTDKVTRLLPISEVISENEFFDFDAKYNGQVKEITPARISQELTEKVQSETSRIYDILGAKGLIRVDYIIPEDGEPVLLEINTTPGMTATSFIPQQVRAAGLDIKDVMTEIIENELKGRD
ncbi:MAG TPA: D-alanine--D-alanine ligase [Candidatus Parabacteroides intestinipullorum]|jgi:D-alanine-D-alanine ligase|uniref:D-alanine--D-alanine ligase n=1 Tax=Candidatus Parabacteroides intestinipullorum TaxID=2838723 RepID=A0A9D1XA26_9BACT|nr:D-alanine--D-alanine ligase [Candidatus Parabacteroides intestinipullorum]